MQAIGANKLYIRNNELVVETHIGDNLYKTYRFKLSEVLKVFEKLLEEVNT